MFLFNKPKASLADLIPDGYTDIHSHLLSGLDDGAKDNDDSLALITGLQEHGFSRFITTPHILTGVWNNTREGITAASTELGVFFKKQAVDVPITAAAEYMMDDVFLKLIETEPLLTIKDNYVLVEMSYLNPPLQLYDIIFQLQQHDYKPILAHPERYNFYHTNPQEYKKLKKAGCLFQINLLSVTGYYGKNVADAAKKLLDAGMINFTGSDVHHQRHVDAFKNKVVIKDTNALVTAINNNSIFK